MSHDRKRGECFHVTCNNRNDDHGVDFYVFRLPSPPSLRNLYDKAVNDRHKYCDPNVQPNVLELGSFNNAKIMMAFLHKITLKNKEGVPLLLAEYKQSDFTAWGENRVKWWQNTSRLEPLAWMWLRFDLRICSQHFEVGVLISF
jgi:hypothetical protein